MKKALLVIVVLLVLYPAVPWLLGRTIEQRVEAMDDQLQTKAPYITLTRGGFRRGWFTSEQDLTLTLTGGALAPLGMTAAGANPPHLTIHNVIHHGPICGLTCFGAARVDSTLEFSDDLKAEIQKLFGTTNVIAASTRLGLGGGYTVTLTSPAFKDIAVGADGHLSTDGFTLTLAENGGADRSSSHGSAPHVAYATAASGSFELTGLAFDSDSQRALGSLSDGLTTFTIAKLGYTGPKGTFSLADFHFGAKLSSDAGFMAIGLQYDTGAIAATNLALASVHVDFTLRHLDMVALEALNTAVRAANQDPQVPAAERTANVLKVMQQQGVAVLLKQPELALDRVSFATAGGEVLLSGAMRLRDFVAGDLAPGMDPKLLLAKVEADLDFSCDEGLLKSLPGGVNFETQLKAFVQQGLVTFDNGKFHSKIQIRRGQPTFNGKTLGGGAAPTAAPTT